jgi:hypothetical protein
MIPAIVFNPVLSQFWAAYIRFHNREAYNVYAMQAEVELAKHLARFPLTGPEIERAAPGPARRKVK